MNYLVYKQNLIGAEEFVASGANAQPGLVPAPPLTEGHSKFLCEDGVWKEIEGGGGLDIHLGDVIGATVVASSRQVTVKWTDPEDFVISGSTLLKWDGTLVVRKKNIAPTNKDDGDVVVDSKVKNQHSSNGFVDTGLENDATYYYRFFPYSTGGVVTNGSTVSATPERIVIATVPTLVGNVTYDGTEQSPNWNDYDSEKMTIGGVFKATDADFYTASFAPKSDYKWSDGTISPKYVNWEIEKADGVITLSDEEVTLDPDNKTVEVTYSGESGVVTVSTNARTIASVSVDTVGKKITISSPSEENGEAKITVKVAESANYKSGEFEISVSAEFLPICTFADGTWEQIQEMLQAHYDGKLNIGDYWSVGDVKTDVPLSAISAVSPLTDTHDAQNIDLVIVGIEHDDLASAINGKTKAAVTLSMKDCLINRGMMNTSSGSYTYARWTTCPRKTWMSSFESALPSSLKSLIKTVTKTTVYPTNSSNTLATETSNEKCFLFSNWELFGANYSSYVTKQDGTQYEYYKTQSNRVKKRSGLAYLWWTRSGFWSSGESAADFVYCNYLGEAYTRDAYNNGGLAVGLCL